MLEMYARRDFYDKRIYVKWKCMTQVSALINRKIQVRNIGKKSSLINR